MSPIAPEHEIGFMRIDRTDFASFTRPQQVRHLGVEGCVVFPRRLGAEHIARIKREMAGAETGHPDYSAAQERSVAQPQWLSPTVAELIGHPPMIEFLTDLMDPDIVFTRGFFRRTRPSCPGIALW